MIVLAAMLLAACSSNNDQEEINKLQAEIKSLQAENASQKEDIGEKIQENNDTHQKELVESLSTCRDSVSHAFLYTYDRTAFKKDLTDYLGLNDLSKNNNPFQRLSNLGLWVDYSEKNITSYDFHIGRFYRVFKYIDKSKSNIQRLFDENKAFLFEAIDSYQYLNTQTSNFVDGLLKTHNNIVNSPNYLTWMAEFQKRKVLPSDARDELVTIFEQQFGAIDNLSILNAYDYADTQKMRMKYWLYSFWMRRYAEGNITQVHAVLLEIQQHYRVKP